MTFTRALATNNYGPAKFIVDGTTTANGTHSTIAAALTSSTSGDTIFIRPGSYTENLTLKAGVNLVAFDSDALTPNVTIIGKTTFTAAGSVSISGIRLQTNSDFFLAVTGSAASIVNLKNCYLNASNNTGISFTVSNTSAVINCLDCSGDIGTTGISLFSHSSTGTLNIYYCRIGSTGSSLTASTCSSGNCIIFSCALGLPITSSSTASLNITFSDIDLNALNTTAVIAGGSGNHLFLSSAFFSGTASAISISSTLQISNCTVGSSNTNAITGAGTIIYTEIAFTDTSSVINTTTKTARNIDVGGISFDAGTNVLANYATGSFTPTIVGGAVTGVTTYSTQNGYYTRIGNTVFVQGQIAITAATGTGNSTIGALPFTVKSQTNGNVLGSFIIFAAGWAWPASTTHLQTYFANNTTTALVAASGSSNAGNFLQMSNAAATIVFSGVYQI